MRIQVRSSFLDGALLALLLGLALAGPAGAVVIPTPGDPPPSGPQTGPVPHNPRPGPVDPGLVLPPPPPPPDPEPPVIVPVPNPTPCPTHHTPEPATLVSSLVGAGLLGLHAWRKRRRSEAER